MSLSRKASARPFETVKVHTQSGLLAARPTAGTGNLGYLYWGEDTETLYSCQRVAGVPTWQPVGSQIFDMKDAVVYASEINVGTVPVLDPVANTLTNNVAGALALGGGAPTAGMRVGLAGQTAGLQNGLFVVVDAGSGADPWVLARSPDASVSAEVTQGMMFMCMSGTNAGKAYILTTPDPIVLDTTALTFAHYAFVSSYDQVKASVRVATAGALAACAFNVGTGVLTGTDLTGVALTFDGSVVALNDRVLVRHTTAGATTGAELGIYEMTTAPAGGIAWVLTRTSDANTLVLLAKGTTVFVSEGTVNMDNYFVLETVNAVLNVTALTFGAGTNFRLVAAALAAATADVNLNNRGVVNVDRVAITAPSAAGVLGDIGMAATGRATLFVGGAESPVALLSDVQTGQPVQGLRPLADAALGEATPTPDTVFFVNKSGASLVIGSAALVSNGALDADGAAPGDLCHILLRKFSVLGVGTTISTISPVNSPADDWTAGLTVNFPAFVGTVTLADGEMLGYQITKEANGLIVPSFLIAATTAYLPTQLPQGMKPILDPALNTAIANTIFYVNRTGAPVIINAAQLIPSGALVANDAAYAVVDLYSNVGAVPTLQGEIDTRIVASGGTGDWVAGVAFDLPITGLGLLNAPVTLNPGDSLSYAQSKIGLGIATPPFLIAITS